MHEHDRSVLVFYIVWIIIEDINYIEGWLDKFFLAAGISANHVLDYKI